jgi:hypothetical protein
MYGWRQPKKKTTLTGKHSGTLIDSPGQSAVEHPGQARGDLMNEASSLKTKACRRKQENATGFIFRRRWCAQCCTVGSSPSVPDGQGHSRLPGDIAEIQNNLLVQKATSTHAIF